MNNTDKNAGAGTMTALLDTMTYSELLDLHGQLTRFFAGHELIPWVEQEIEIREEQMRWAMGEMYEYADRYSKPD